MATLVYVDHSQGQFKKAAFEAIHYATSCGGAVHAIILGSASPEALSKLGAYGAEQVWHDGNSTFDTLDAQQYSAAIVQIAEQINATTVIFSNNNTAKAVAARVAAKLSAGIVCGAVSKPTSDYVITKSVFSGKAFANVKIVTEKKVVCITPNSFAFAEGAGSASVNNFTATVPEKKINITAVDKATGSVPLPEAELVVSGGRGLKGPENWGIVEALASSLGAELACSRPVADSHWRPHHEHVGQTGGTIRPNLYIAIGISGAIQHLAGVNASKTIVVINKDPEAPFFKAADYGVCGDAFEIVPKLTEAVNKWKASLA